MSKARESELLAVDAFCGAGGISLGLRDAGFEVVAAFDNNERAVQSYQSNIGQHAFLADIRDVSVSQLEAISGTPSGSWTVICGGAPCQGFSTQRRNGENDPRNSLPLAFLDMVSQVGPQFFVFENVPGIKGRHGSVILATFLREAESRGYHCHTQVLDAVNYAVPQRRKRLFIVGEKPTNQRTYFKFPEPITDSECRETSVGFAFKGLPSPPSNFKPHPKVANHRRTRMSELNAERLSHVPPGGGMMDIPRHLRVNCHKDGPDRIGHRYVYGRLHSNEPAATITARFDSFTRGKFAHPTENRNITLREGARLQTFPDSFIFVGNQEEIASQIGNAVPPRLAYYLGNAIAAAVARAKKRESRLSQQHVLFPE